MCAPHTGCAMYSAKAEGALAAAAPTSPVGAGLVPALGAHKGRPYTKRCSPPSQSSPIKGEEVWEATPPSVIPAKAGI